MPTLVITDETAAASAIAINSSRDYGIGGSAVDRVTTHGNSVATTGGVADASTVDSTSVTLTTGSVSIAAAASSTITTTVASRQPTASLVSSRMAVDIGGVLKTIPLFQIDSLANGSFRILNQDTSGASGASTAAYQYL